MTEVLKRCSACCESKPLSAYHKNRAQPDGWANQCKVCFRLSRTKWRTSHRGRLTALKARQSLAYKEGQARYCKTAKRKRDLEKYKQSHRAELEARAAVNNLVRRGLLPRPDSLFCAYCGEGAAVYHHYRGYSVAFRTTVVPACFRCHGKTERKVAY